VRPSHQQQHDVVHEMLLLDQRRNTVLVDTVT
jgi:hypothetical protein